MGVVEAKLSVKDDAKSSSSSPPPPNFSMDGAHRGLASMMPEEKPLDVVGDPEIPEPADGVGFDQDPESPKKGGEEGVAAAAEKGVWPGFSQRPDAIDCAFYMKTGTCKFGLNCRFNHPPKRRHRAKPEKQSEYVQAAREKGKETTSEKGEQTEFKAGTEEGKETTLGKGGLIEHKAAMEKSKETTLEKGGQIECKFYTMPGGCKYGKSCKYVHSQKKMEGNSSKLNFLGLPIRLGAKECPYYMRTGNCKFSTNCRYHHPDPTVAMVGHDPHSGCQSSGSMQQSAFGASTMPVTPSRSQGTLNGPTSFVVASPACSPASNLHSQGFHSNSGCNGYQQVHIDEYPERPGQPECHYYMKNGFCPFKSVCKFDHPKSHLPTKSNGVSIPSCPPQ